MADKNVKFSIIVPVYKVEKYLDRCVQSLLNQTYGNIEIILVDDGSPDSCPAMCDRYREQDSRVKAVHKENGGLSDARNKGMECADGDYILFVDSDDYIELDTCQRLAGFAEHGYDILVGNAQMEGRPGNLHHMDCHEILTGTAYLKQAAMAHKDHAAACLNIYRREFLLENQLRFKVGILHEDVEFTPRVFLNAQSVCCTFVTFYHYIVRDDSITTQKDQRKNVRDLYATCCELENLYRQLSDTEMQKILLDGLVASYLSSFYGAKAFQYGKAYIHRRFCIRNAYLKKTKLKSWLFFVSPRLYWYINAHSKTMFR